MVIFPWHYAGGSKLRAQFSPWQPKNERNPASKARLQTPCFQAYLTILPHAFSKCALLFHSRAFTRKPPTSQFSGQLSL